MSSSNNNNNNSSNSGGGGRSHSGSGGSGGSDRGHHSQATRAPQNRQPNQQHHSNRIYTRYNDNRPHYGKSNHGNQRSNNNNNHNQQQTSSNNSIESLINQRQQRQRLASSMSIGDASKMCICCWHELRTYVYYSCAHYVCLNCSIKMRVLCEKIDCPVCRQESRRVLCTKQVLHQTSTSDSSTSPTQPSGGVSPQTIEKLIDKLASQNGCLKEPATAVAAGIYYDSETIRLECEDLLSFRCTLCTSTTTNKFTSMDELDKHMRKAHHRFYCELCLENLKMFPFERKFYDREGLAMHKRVGDKDDSSFKGHPLCKNIYYYYSFPLSIYIYIFCGIQQLN